MVVLVFSSYRSTLSCMRVRLRNGPDAFHCEERLEKGNFEIKLRIRTKGPFFKSGHFYVWPILSCVCCADEQQCPGPCSAQVLQAVAADGGKACSHWLPLLAYCCGCCRLPALPQTVLRARSLCGPCTILDAVYLWLLCFGS